MSPASFRFDHRDFPASLQAILASLEERFPTEITIVDYCEVTCHTRRAETILSALTDDAPSPEIEQIAASEPTPVELYRVALPADQQKTDSDRICAECGQPFTPKNKASKHCSDVCKRKAANRHYRETHPKSGGGGNGNTHHDSKLGETRLLDIHTGEILEHQDVLSAIRDGKYPAGKRFRRSRNRIYEVVEQNRNGHPRLTLKQVYDPLPIA